MKFMKTVCSIAFAWSGMAIAASPTHSDIQGATTTKFITRAVGTMPEKFAIPVVLYFNREGCLAWSNFGLKDDWANDLARKAADLDATCPEPSLPGALEQLESDGVALKAAEIKGPVAIWYGSDAMCADCKAKSSNDLPAILDQLPDSTRLIKLDWK